MIKNEEGFTLVELAIVLVIIGLLLGGILKGQELIKNAKIKKIYSAQREIVAALYTYNDRYSKNPGDDNKAKARWSGATNGNGDGKINVFSTACATNATDESCQAWQHMRLAGILSGGSNVALNPDNAFGGKIALGQLKVQGLDELWVGMTNIPFDIAQILDDKYDDGNFKTGPIRGSGDYTAAKTGTFTVYFEL